jgi:hypothetical protein
MKVESLERDPGAKGEWQWDITTDTVTWSEQLCRIAGYGSDATLPPLKEHSRFYTPASFSRLLTAVLRVLTAGAPYEIELQMVQPDGTKRWVMSSGEAVRDAANHIVYLRGSVEDISDYKRGQPVPNPPLPADGADHSLTRHLINSHEEEKACLSRQLTDDISQALALLACKIRELGPASLDLMTQHHMVVEGLWQQTDEIIARVYGLAQELRPATLDLIGLGAAIRGLCREFSDRWRINVECTISVLPEIDRGLALSFFRVCQEAVCSLRKHLGAKNIKIELTSNERDLVLRGTADRAERVPQEANYEGGVDQRSMQERLHLVGGKLAVWSHSSVGIQFEARAPWARSLRESGAA